MAMIGNPIVSTDFPVDYFSGNNSTTAFTLSVAPASVNAIDVQVSGVAQSPQTYSVSGTTLTFSAAPPTGSSNIVVRHRGVAGIPNTPSAGSVVNNSIADATITAAKFAAGQTPAFNGIAFPATQSASTDANTLDDYEEGTWTPVITAASGSITSYTVQTATYTKIGRSVTVNVQFTITNNGTGAQRIQMINSLPFATQSSLPFAGSGREGNVVGFIVMTQCGASDMIIWKADNTYPGGTNYQIFTTVTYFV